MICPVCWYVSGVLRSVIQWTSCFPKIASLFNSYCSQTGAELHHRLFSAMSQDESHTFWLWLRSQSNCSVPIIQYSPQSWIVCVDALTIYRHIKQTQVSKLNCNSVIFNDSWPIYINICYIFTAVFDKSVKLNPSANFQLLSYTQYIA